MSQGLRKGSVVSFEIAEVLPIPVATAWSRLVDWRGHGDWVPMTRVEVDPVDSNRFVAWSGMGRLALEDRMHADSVEFDGTHGRGHVNKLGPVLVGDAEFAVAPGRSPDECVVGWRETVTVPYLPAMLSGLVGRIGAALFRSSVRRMARLS